MGIVGNLRTMQLEELLQWLSQSKKSGTLEINSGKVDKRIYFKDGRILSSSSSKPEEYLGHFLVSHGLISEMELSKAIELQEKTRTLLGKILVTTGALRENDLHRMLRLKAEESIYDVFSWTEADFRFLDDVLPESAMVPMSLDVTAIVMEGVQRVDEWHRIRQLIPSQEAIPVTVRELDIENARPAERRILELVDDQRTIEEIRLQTHSSEFHVCRVLFEQHRLGTIKVVKPRWSSAPPDGGAPTDGGGPSPGTTTAAIAATLSATALLEAARLYLEQQSYEAALRHLRAARSLEPENREVQAAMTEGEKQIRQEIERDGIKLAAIPKLAATMEQLTSAKISPQEGFMLTRINGTYDIQSIIKITPIPQIDALMVFWKLAKAGHILIGKPTPR
jgi:tetratricopeptide (TPR) repeat protein